MMNQLLTLFFIVTFCDQTRSQSCGRFTTRDTPGPFFVENVPQKYKLAPDNELNDRNQAVVLRGRVFDANCRGIPDAVVDIWYAGGENPHYTFRPDELVYRGKSRTSQSGDYEFLATFPGVYSGRPIPHYHVQVSTRTTTFITQIYFKNLVPKGFENYVRTRGSQFGRVSFLQTNTAGLRNGGRLVNFDMKINN